MLLRLREKSNGLGFRIVVGMLIFVLAVFGFGGAGLLAGGGQEVASVNGVDITGEELNAEAQMELGRIAGQMGENFDPSMIDNSLLQRSVLNRLVSRELLAQHADDLGLGVSAEQVNNTIVQDPGFAIDGRFDEGAYRQAVRSIGLTPQRYMDQVERNLTLAQFTTAITDSAFLPEQELRSLAALLGQTRDVGTLTFAPDKFAEGIEIDDATVAVHYQENERSYMTEESVDAELVVYSWEQLLDDASIEIREEDVVAAFDEEVANAGSQQQRSSSHILLQVNDDREESAALQEIVALAQQVADGADFAELASANSEDPGSKSSGGSLGFVGQGVFDPAFEAALWELEETGNVSAPVRTSFGYHLIRLDGIQEQPIPQLSARRDDLEKKLKEAQARELFNERLNELDSLAFEQPGSLQGLADTFGVAVQAAEGVTRNRGSGLFLQADVRDALFADKVRNDNENSPAVRLEDDRAVVVRAKSLHEPALRPLDEVKESIRAELLADAKRDAANTAFSAAMARVEAGESVNDVARDYDLRWERSEKLRRSSPTPSQEVVRAAFALAPPSALGKSVSSAVLQDDTQVIVTVSQVVDGDYSAMTEREREGLQNYLKDRASRLDFTSLYATFEDDANIDLRIATPAES